MKICSLSAFSEMAAVGITAHCRVDLDKQLNRKVAEKHYRRIGEFAPKTGVVRLLRLTEKLYDNIYFVTGKQYTR